MHRKPKIFIGSSSEGELVDKEVRNILGQLEVAYIHWRDLVNPGENILDALLNVVPKVDGALFIMTPDDPQLFRDSNRRTPRDNLLFEAGFFIAALGKRRTGILTASIGASVFPVLPTNLESIQRMSFTSSNMGKTKDELQKWVNRLEEVIGFEAYSRWLPLQRNALELPRGWQGSLKDYIFDPICEKIEKATSGEIYLRPEQYYSSLFQEMDMANCDTEVWAVASLPPKIWSDNSEQALYHQKNLDAANGERQVKIRRIFSSRISSDKTLKDRIQQQLDSKNIEIGLTTLSALGKNQVNADMVIFVNAKTDYLRAYTAFPDSQDSNRISHGLQNISKSWCESQLKKIQTAWTISMKIRSIDQLSSPDREIDLGTPPGKRLSTHTTLKPVVSCHEAARERGVPLKNELKTLILETSRGTVAAHIPGDRELDLRAIKKILGCAEARLASIEKLYEMGMGPGTVSAILEPTWSLLHLISKNVLELKFLTTNNGTLTGYFRFEPWDLLNAKKVFLGELEKQVPADS